MVLDDRLLVTSFVEGITMSDVIKGCLKGKDDLGLVRQAGLQIAKMHNSGASFGNIKPKNIIVNANRLFFTDMEQFVLDPSDQVWDLAQFISWDLKGTRNNMAVSRIVREFLAGYKQTAKDETNLLRLSKSRRYLESFFPILSPSVAGVIKDELRRSVG